MMGTKIKNVVPAEPGWICEIFPVEDPSCIKYHTVHMWAVVETDHGDLIEPVVLSEVSLMTLHDYILVYVEEDDVDYRLRRKTQTEQDLEELFC